jgi:hypothetical protein
VSTVIARNILSPDGGVADNLKPVTASAWVNFDGTGVVTIRDSYNVSSVADNGTGNYTVNFQNTLLNNNYSANTQGGQFAVANINLVYPVFNFQTTSCGVSARNPANGAFVDADVICFTVTGGQS